MKKIIVAVVAGLALFSTAACEYSDAQPSQAEQIDKKADKTKTFVPKNDVERKNYEAAQKVYDDPNSILWCTTSWGNPSAPLVTIPIAGKLTSSSVSVFPNKRNKVYGSNDSVGQVENRSVDGMYHGTPTPYRYGFTPGGQYVEFLQMDTLCTTALTSFQRQKTEVTVKFDGGQEQKESEAALKSGDRKAAEDALAGLEGAK